MIDYSIAIKTQQKAKFPGQWKWNKKCVSNTQTEKYEKQNKRV